MILPISLLALAGSAAAWGADYVAALYSLTNNAEQSIIVSAINKWGQAEFATVVPTHGKGPGPRYNEAMGYDPLQSQGGLAVAGQFLFAVNPGDGTISMFAIDEYDPTQIVQLGNNTASGGSYPNSIAVNPMMNMVCVISDGEMNGLQCFSASLAGLCPMGPFWPFGLNQTNPPVGPPNTPSDVLFSEDGSQLFVSVKGSGNASEAFQGFIWSFAVEDGNLTKTGDFTPPGTPLAFSMTLFPMDNEWNNDTTLLVTDPGTGGVDIVAFSSNGSESYYMDVMVPNKAAPCWSEYDCVTDAFYVVDTGTSTVSMLAGSPMNISVVNQMQFNSTMGGNNFLTDLSILQTGWNQSYMYVNAEVDGAVLVFSLTPGNDMKMIQMYEIGAAVNATGWVTLGRGLEGSAIYYKPEWLRMEGY